MTDHAMPNQHVVQIVVYIVANEVKGHENSKFIDSNYGNWILLKEKKQLLRIRSYLRKLMWSLQNFLIFFHHCRNLKKSDSINVVQKKKYKLSIKISCHVGGNSSISMKGVRAGFWFSGDKNALRTNLYAEEHNTKWRYLLRLKICWAEFILFCELNDLLAHKF